MNGEETNFATRFKEVLEKSDKNQKTLSGEIAISQAQYPKI